MSHRAVLDASAAIHVVCDLPAARHLLAVLAEVTLVVAPDLYSSEVANTLWKYVQHGSLSADEAGELLVDAGNLIDLRVPAAELVDEALVAAIVQDHPVYDMLYAVLARRHGARVITMDRRLVSALAKMDVDAVFGEA